MLRLRWVTWWPAPYWTARFDALASEPTVSLEVLYLASGSKVQGWTNRSEEWGHTAELLHDSLSMSGYGARSLRLSGVRRITHNAREWNIVLPYGDFACLAASITAKARGGKYHLFVANHEREMRRRRPPTEGLKRVMFHGASGYLVTGPQQAEYAMYYGAKDDAISMVGNPAAPLALCAEPRDDIRSAFGWDGRVIVLSVGRLAPEKDFDTLIAAAARIRSDGPPVMVAIAGAGPEAGRLQSLAMSFGLEIRLLGFLEGVDLARAYAAADVFVLPSRSEAWGLVINEAMSAGLPVVVSDRVGARHLAIEGGGSMFGVGNTDELVRELRPLVLDERSRSERGNTARTRISSETVRSWVLAVSKHFDRSMEHHPHRGQLL